jgi:putative ABC transport system permease protein
MHELGANVMAVIAQPSTTRDGLEQRHVRMLRKNFPEALVTSLRMSHAPTLGTDKQLRVVATDHVLSDVRQWAVTDGRFLEASDILHAHRYAVITEALSKIWNWSVGNVIMLRNTPFIVVGIVNAGGNALDAEYGDSRLILGERAVFVPQSVPQLWKNSTQAQQRGVNAVFIQAPQTVPAAKLMPAVQRVLQQPDQRAGRLSWVTPESLVRGLTRLQRTLGVTIGAVAVLCLILGGTTLMSLMVANVRDRVTEIGLRRALGASRGEVAGLFVLEGITITLAAGAFGTLAGHGVLLLSEKFLPHPAVMTPLSATVPIAVAVILGIVFSYWPANVAAKIAPAEALRND